MIHQTAIIDPKAKLHSSVKIGPYSVVGPNVEIDENTEVQSHVSIVGNTKIGKNNKIYPFASIGNNPQDLKFQGEETKLEIGNDNKIREYVTINPGTNGGGGVTKVGNKCLFMVSAHIAHDCFVGNNVKILDNCTIGKHGFGFFPNNKKNLRYPHIGIVLIEDNCEIGCNATIDRGSMSNTVIGKNTFLDNQIHIAHNVKIGENSIIAGQVGIAGSSILGKNVKIGGQAGISGHLRIGDNVEIAGGSGVIKDIPENSKVMGYPAKNIRQFLKDNK